MVAVLLRAVTTSCCGHLPCRSFPKAARACGASPSGSPRISSRSADWGNGGLRKSQPENSPSPRWLPSPPLSVGLRDLEMAGSRQERDTPCRQGDWKRVYRGRRVQRRGVGAGGISGARAGRGWEQWGAKGGMGPDGGCGRTGSPRTGPLTGGASGLLEGSRGPWGPELGGEMVHGGSGGDTQVTEGRTSRNKCPVFENSL